MNEEEKKAIEYIRNTTFNFLEHPFCNTNKVQMNLYDFKKIETLLNLIEKQQKEIEEQKEEKEKYMKLSASSLARGLNESIRNKEKNKTELELLNEGWKQKIRDKIKELEKELKSIQDKLSKNMLFSESEFYSFSEYTKWRIEINQKIKDIDAKIAILKELLEE